ncbi:complex I NDUFA9 subunit family protein, partial [Escherichia coli]
PSVLFGPEDDFFNRFAAIAQYAPALPLIGGGTTRLQPAYVGDVAEAIALTLEPDAATGQTWSLGGPEIYTLKQIMALVTSRIGRHRLLVPVPWA